MVGRHRFSPISNISGAEKLARVPRGMAIPNRGRLPRDRRCYQTERRRHHSNAAGLSSGSPAGPQWPRRCLSTKGHLKKFRHLRIKGNCQLFENSDRRILPAPLKPADVRPINTGVDGQRFLRQPAANAQPSDISGYHSLRIHGRKRPFVGLLNHGQ
jgi:hypothetical protein